MHKKDYELIAREIKEVKQWIPNSTMADKDRLLAGAELVMFELANEFGKHDFKFNRQKFLTACGIDTGFEPSGVEKRVLRPDLY